MFFTFDGIDGTGKSTQSRLLREALQDQGYSVVTCRDPGTTELGERLRAIVVEGDATHVGQRSETLLYMAARAQLVEEVIRPALDAKQVVLCDRFLLANVVYQAYGLGLSAEAVWSVGEFATGGLMPHQTFLLDLDVSTAFGRVGSRRDRMESRGADYFERVRQGFLTEARRLGDHVTVLDATASIPEIHQRILRVATGMLRAAEGQC